MISKTAISLNLIVASIIVTYTGFSGPVGILFWDGLDFVIRWQLAYRCRNLYILTRLMMLFVSENILFISFQAQHITAPTICHFWFKSCEDRKIFTFILKTLHIFFFAFIIYQDVRNIFFIQLIIKLCNNILFLKQV